MANSIHEPQYNHCQGFCNNSNLKCLVKTNRQVAEKVDEVESEENISSTTPGLSSKTNLKLQLEALDWFKKSELRNNVNSFRQKVCRLLNQ